MQHIPPRTIRLLSLAVTALTIVVVLVAYPGLPDPLPLHFSGAEPTVLREKNLITVLSTPAIGLVAWLVVRLLSTDPTGRVAPVDTSGAQEGVALPYSETLATRISNRIDARSAGLAWALLGFTVGLAYVSLCAVIPALNPGSRLSMLAIAVFFFAGLLGMVQVMSRERKATLDAIYPDDEEFARGEILVENQQLYRFGGSYVNPLDPMPMLSARRDPMSFDYNYAHAPGKRFLLLLLSTFLVIAAAIVIWTIPS